MDEEQVVEQDTLEPVETDDTSEHQVVESENNEELEKARKLAENQKIRAEKAEKELKKLKKQGEEKSAPTQGYSLADIRALNNVHEEDVERVEKFAKAEGLTIAEAVKHEDMQAILATRAEKRRAVEATNTGKTPRSAGKISDEQILSEAYSGKEVDPAQLAQARFNARIKSMENNRR